MPVSSRVSLIAVHLRLSPLSRLPPGKLHFPLSLPYPLWISRISFLLLTTRAKPGISHRQRTEDCAFDATTCEIGIWNLSGCCTRHIFNGSRPTLYPRSPPLLRLHSVGDVLARLELHRAQLEGLLEIQPQLGRGAEVAGQARCGVGGDSALALQDHRCSSARRGLRSAPSSSRRRARRGVGAPLRSGRTRS